ncbi:MAG: Rpn family recombination-promoting nuclease/putative transposase [Spirochaetaceae bacterium]|nr:Rpn family recombination-promoting nuclease/putative transposase [Spirochaetaceae bacterium]
MVQDVLRACLPAHRLAAADFSSLGKLSAEYVSDELRTRHGDTVWHLRLGRRRVFLLMLLEFQAQDDHWMALRILTYSGLLYQELVRNQAPEMAGERLPAVMPVVLYNGTEPWTAARNMGALITPVGPWLAPYQPAQHYYLLDLQRVRADDLPHGNLLRAVARLEQSRSPEEVVRVVQALRRWLPNRGAEELHRAFVDWVRQIVGRLAPTGATVPSLRTLEEASMTLVERVAEWPKQWLREGREQGVAEGREQGVDEQRALLCRMAGARFDAETAVRLADLLAPITDAERLAEVGDWLVRCDTAGRFLSRFDPESPT